MVAEMSLTVPIEFPTTEPTSTTNITFKDHIWCNNPKEEPQPDALDEELNIHFGLTNTESKLPPVTAHITGLTLAGNVGAFIIKDDNLPQNFGTASENYADQCDEHNKTLNKDWLDFRRIREGARQHHEEANQYTVPTTEETSWGPPLGDTSVFTKQEWKRFFSWVAVLGTCAAVLYQVFA